MNKTYQVSEAADELETEVYTLRYWENQLGIEVPRNLAGHRYYEEEQMLMFRSVKRLKEAGFTLRQIKAMGPKMASVASLPDEKIAELRKKIAGMEGEQDVTVAEDKGEESQKQEKEQRDMISLPLCVGGTEERVTKEAEERAEGVRMLQEGITRWLGEVLQKNNEQLSRQIEDGVTERMARELRFLFRQQEEREEERFRRLDRAIRERQNARAGMRQQAAGHENFFLMRKSRPLR